MFGFVSFAAAPFSDVSVSEARTLTALSGTYSVSGQSATLRVDNPNVYPLFGSSAFAQLPFSGDAGAAASGYSITALNGTYSISGQSSTVSRSKQLNASSGSYAVAGQTASIVAGTVTQVDYSLFGFSTFSDAPFAGSPSPTAVGYSIDALHGTYILNGQSADLLRSKSIVANNGTYAVTGQTASIVKGSSTQIDYFLLGFSAFGDGPFAGSPSVVVQGYVITASHGTYALTGQSADLLFSRQLNASSGSYAISGQTIDLSVGQVYTSFVSESASGADTVVAFVPINAQVFESATITAQDESAIIVSGELTEFATGTVQNEGFLFIGSHLTESAGVTEEITTNGILISNEQLA